ncbi:MAG: UvrD-helicase domain-containing protein, partial [Clostridiales bacterium]|nr:UvrD-helicase domain-containing protein [Candidatus Coliplasma equi]
MAEYNEDLVRSRAVTERNKDIIISAGAGSGKTTVLTNRLISHVRDDRKNVTDFLAVTFTNASARDIKDKLASALTEAITKDPSDVHLQKQLSLVPQANISTISSYCLSLVRENFSTLAVSPSACVLDEAEARMMLTDACDELINEIYKDGDERFLKVAENFTGTKSDDKLITVLTSLYTDLRVNADPDKFLRDSAEKLFKEADITEKGGFFACDTGKFVQQKLITE